MTVLFSVCLVVGIFKRLAGIFLEENRHMHKYIRAPRILNPVDPKLNQINRCNLALSTVGVGLVLYPEPFRKDNVFET